MQHVYAVVFAGVITALLAAIILYYDYGFWRTKYSRGDDLEILSTKKDVTDTADTLVTVTSPGAMIGNFLKEAGERARSINTDTSSFLKGKVEYTKEKE